MVWMYDGAVARCMCRSGDKSGEVSVKMVEYEGISVGVRV